MLTVEVTAAVNVQVTGIWAGAQLMHILACPICRELDFFLNHCTTACCTALPNVHFEVFL